MSDRNFDVASPIAAGFSASWAELAVTARELAGRHYREERDSIYRYLVSLGTNPSEAQDLTQETFLRLYVALRKRKPIENTRAWLFTVAFNLAMNHRRWWNYRLPAREEDVDHRMHSQADPRATPEQALLHRETAVRLREAIDGLSRQQQACLHLRTEGFRYREIARILGVSLPTVAEFLRRAVIRLKKAMNE
jgi:RNA polymerase sigma-70 factor (ECF subfamily)